MQKKIEVIKRASHQRTMSAFTLIEVLVALAITAIIGVVAYGGLDSALTAMERSEAQGQKLNEVNILLAIMSRDFRQAMPRPVRGEYAAEWEHAFDAPESALFAVRFSRGGWANPRPEQFVRSDMQRVVYALEEDKIIRESWYVMDRTDDSESVRVAIVEGVTHFKLKFLDANVGSPQGGVAAQPQVPQLRESWPYPYTTSPSTQPSDKLPLAVEITMELEGWGEIVRIFELPGNE